MKNKIILASILLVIFVIGLWALIYTFRPISDLEKIQNFSAIQTKIAEFYKNNKKLPTTLGELSGLPAKYEYKIQSDTNFELCATFDDDVTQEINDKAPIKVKFEKGDDCVVFNVADAAQTDPEGTVTQRDVALVAATNKISVSPVDGVSAGSINIKFDPAQTLYYKNDTDGNYFINFLATVSTDKNCTESIKPEKGCCYSLNEVSLTSLAGTSGGYNRLGTPEYINPYPANAENQYGDLPTNLCFSGIKEYTGRISFTLSKEMINTKTSNKLMFKHINNGATSGLLEVTIN
jgi:hypothetical protein